MFLDDLLSPRQSVATAHRKDYGRFAAPERISPSLYGRESGDRVLRNSDSGMGLYAYGFETTSQFSIGDIFSPVIPAVKITTAPNRRFCSG
jgi:hypothetical protein